MDRETELLEHLSDRDLDFVVGAVVAEPRERPRVRELVRDKADFVELMLDDPRLYRRIVADQEILLKVSPYLLFTVLLRQVRRELSRSWTLEWTGPRERVPVFDAPTVRAVLENPTHRRYLAEMLASFTRVHSATLHVRVGDRTVRLRVSELDPRSLERLVELVGETQRLALWRRLGDVTLFLTGIFPDHLGAGTLGARLPGADDEWGRAKGREERGLAIETLDALERQGQLYYRRAAEHPNAPLTGLDQVLGGLADEFRSARKALNFLADRFIHHLRFSWFPSPS